MIKIAILVVCFVLSIGIMIMFPKIKNFLAAIITAGLDDLTRKLPTAALNFMVLQRFLWSQASEG